MTSMGVKIRAIIVFIFSFSLNSAFVQELTEDKNTLLLLHFNGTAVGAAGETPISSSNLFYANGRLGNALLIQNKTTIRYNADENIDPRKGTLEFWTKPLSEGVLLDMGIAGGLSAQIGKYTRMIFNIYGINGKPEVGVFGNNSIWQPGHWHHIAFTWENRELKLYYDGILYSSQVISFDLPDVKLPYFNIGSTINGEAEMMGLVDELRISNVARTSEEIYRNFNISIPSNEMGKIFIKNIDTIQLYKTWNLYLDKPGFWKTPELFTLKNKDTIVISNTSINWKVSDESVVFINKGILTAIKPGIVFLYATINNQLIDIPVKVIEPVLKVSYESNINSFLSKPADCSKVTVPVVVIVYLPTKDGINIDINETDRIPINQQNIDTVKEHILRINCHTKFSLEEGSKFRGYSNPDAYPYAGYKIVDYIYVFEPVPRGFPAMGSPGVFFGDYNQIISRFNGKRYVDTLGVKEFWIMGYHYGEIAPVESNMSSPFTGDISNSHRFQDDLPVFSKTYIVYNYNMTRGGNEATHNHGHQIEVMIDYVALFQDGNMDLPRKKFRGYTERNGTIGRCGDTHHVPNSTSDYDYNNITPIASDIMNWEPDGGRKTLVNVDTWKKIHYSWSSILSPQLLPNAESNWYIMWMQSIPGYGNSIPYKNNWMTNWWRFLIDWDDSSAKIGLYQSKKEESPVCQ